MEVTAYTAGYESTGKSPGDPTYGITASGEPVKAVYTIACPPSMAFGTRLDIEGVGVRTCEDRGGAITEGRLDVYMPDLAEALAFGRQELNVEIKEESE
jgi:3D (Asp-Asp-Asp) domain-containing protein